MKRLVTSFTLLFAMCCGVMAQNEAIYQYRNDGKGKSMFLKSKVDSVVYSQKDIQSNVKNEYVVQEIWTQDSVYRTPLDAIDHIDFVTLKNCCPDEHHPHAVDLGLPSGTKWACCNVGASFPEAYGGYYAWGETIEKDEYSWDTYAHYNSNKYSFINIGSDITGSSFDVAHVRMGGSWQMPTVEQLKELYENCDQEWTQQNGVDGILVTGPNDAQIFLPAPGYRSKSDLYDEGKFGFYWSGTLCSDSEYCGYYLRFNEDNWDWGNGNRGGGRSVRAVCP